MGASGLAVVTGASSGIGAAAARLLAARGSALLLIARRGETLEEFAAALRLELRVPVDCVAADLTSEAGLATVLAALKQHDNVIETLINNAGMGIVGPFADMAPDAIRRSMDLNMTAPTCLARAVLPGMVGRRCGQILNIASTAAFQPGPGMAVYFATKGYIASLSQALSVETAGTGVTVTTYCPGPTATEFGALSGMDRTMAFTGFLPMADPESVARGAIEAMERGRRLVVHGWFNKLLIACSAIIPTVLAMAITRRLLNR